jgi:site-specific DNA-methyltransferase (adenine-specific)
MFKYCWYWRKNNASGFANAKKRPLKVIEDILIFSNGTPIYIPQGLMKLDKPRIRTAKVGDTVGGNGFYDGYEQTETNYPKNCIEFNLDKEKLHPTQKPVALFEYLIKTYSNEGDLVLDNCMGSGTTGVACKNINRNFIGIELDPEYFKIAEKRINENL